MIREKLAQDLNEVEKIKIQDKRAPLSNKKSFKNEAENADD